MGQESILSSRACGILLHPTSLPGGYGIGGLGNEAYRFVDFLAETGQRLWQVLPLGPTGFGNSPYQSPSTFAGNSLLIDLEILRLDGLLDEADLKGAPLFPQYSVDYEVVRRFQLAMLEKSFQLFGVRASSGLRSEFEVFCQQNHEWLDDFALFMAVKSAQKEVAWNRWQQGIMRRASKAIQLWRKRLAKEIRVHKYVQFQFFRQWTALKSYCNQKKVRLIGDVPIYVAMDSTDVWAHPEIFQLDGNGEPTVVAGVPPDYFSETGQLWGNPIYRWDVIAKDDYKWWVERLRATLKLVDVVRIDHFRGFENYWEVPAGETTAVNGRWVPGPGSRLFEALKRSLGDLSIIAEDLGLITPEVHALRDRFGFPGLRVLQFAFDGGRDNPHLPDNYQRNCVVYTGTHDNDTSVGWFHGGAGGTTLSQSDAMREKRRALEYLGTTGEEIHWSFIRLAMSSAANTVIIPLQDVLGLGSEARMNRPGTTKGNWEWRFTVEQLTNEVRRRLREMTDKYGR